jgi:uncharacterized HAD superfamily protein
MSKHRWGFDLDGCTVMFKPAFSKWLKKHLRIDYGDEELVHYDWYKSIPGLSKEDYYREFGKFIDAGEFTKLTVVDGAMDFINSVPFYRFITARPDKAFNSTIKFFELQNLDVNKLIFANKVPDHKYRVARRLGITHFVEDSPAQAMSLADNGIVVYLMDASYNKDVSHPNIVRVGSWSEIGEAVNV